MTVVCGLMRKSLNWTITRRESKYARRKSNRRVRHVTRVRIRQGRDDVLPKAPRTEGWMTW